MGMGPATCPYWGGTGNTTPASTRPCPATRPRFVLALTVAPAGGLCSSSVHTRVTKKPGLLRDGSYWPDCGSEMSDEHLSRTCLSSGCRKEADMA